MQYRFDLDSFKFMKVTTSVSRWVLRAAWAILGSLAIATVGYIVFSFFINTDLERQLSRENRMYERLYSDFVEQQKLIGEVTDGLQKWDDEIYDQIFHADAPSVDPVGQVEMEMSGDIDVVEKNFLSIFEKLKEGAAENFPAIAPVADITYAQTGASVGMKFNPFYKIDSQHGGLDIIAGQGESVYATADGTVTEVTRSGKGLGNVITIDHGNGYETRYAHLSDISVSKGQKVLKGKKIATVGVSGNTFAPHLHYEVLFHGIPQDPVNYMFATLSPSEYANVSYVSASTGQSLD